MIVRKDVEARQHAWYVRNCMESAIAPLLEKILLKQLEIFNAGEDPDPEDDRSNLFPGVKTGSARMADLRRLLQGSTTPVRSDAPFEANVRFARDEFSLDPIETQILVLLLRYERNPYLEQFADLVSQKLRNAVRTVATLIGACPRLVQLRLGPNGTLVSSGLLINEDDGSDYRDLGGPSGPLRLSPPLRKAMNAALVNAERIFRICAEVKFPRQRGGG
jgi:hypothetical protein